MSVRVAVGVNAFLLVGALFGIAYFGKRRLQLDAEADAIGAATWAMALYALLLRKPWARLVVGSLFGVLGVVVGCIMILAITISGGRPLNAWPAFVFFPLFMWIGLAFLLGKAERGYFARLSPTMDLPDPPSDVAAS
jgi:hypothetical protein